MDAKCPPTRPRRPISQAQAFTLIELLVVIAIIGVLAAIIIPVVGRVRDNARSAQCTSNLRQVSTALLLYAAENKGAIPAVYATYGNLVGAWTYTLWPYAGYSADAMDPSKAWGQFSASAGNQRDPKNIFICPGTDALKGDTPGFGNVVPNPNLFSYGLNSVHLDAPSDAWMRPTRIADIVSPANTSMVCESSYLLGDEGGYRSWFGLLPHKGAANFVFFDGHVERLPASKIPSTSTAAGRRFWQGR